MSLKELIEQRDAEVAIRQEIANRLSENIKHLLSAIRMWNIICEWGYEGDDGIDAPFVYLDMKMWPKTLGEQHLNYIKGMDCVYMLTLSHEQAEAMRLSVFEGKPSGSVHSGWLYEWRFDYRQDGWVELLVGR